MKKMSCLVCALLCVLTLSGCIERIHEVYPHNAKWDDNIKTEDKAFVLQDGTQVSLWQPDVESNQYSYRLQDGQVLLEVTLPLAVDKAEALDLDGYQSMKPEALDVVLAYYEAQKPKFEISELLEDAYTDYTLCMEEGERFWPHSASCEVEFCGETERFTGFATITEVSASARGTGLTETSQVVMFDKNTGDIIPPEDLFTVSKEEAKQALVECCKKHMAPNDLEIIRPLISTERVQWMQEGIRMYFEKEEVPDLDSDGGLEILIEYDDIKEFLQQWAIPEEENS